MILAPKMPQVAPGMETRPEATPPPLWPHQQAALDFAGGKAAVMLDMAMRTGKTRVSVELLVRRGIHRALILCPKRVVDVWPEQVARYSDYTALALNRGTIAKRLQLAAAYRGNLIIINYDACWREPFKSWALSEPWDALIMDESHRVKAPGGVASRFVATLSKRVPFRLGLTGTPMPHSPLDIYAQYRALDPTIFGTSYRRFMYEYAVTKPMQGFEMVVGFKNQDKLRARIYSIAFHVGKDVLNLPEPLHLIQSCQPSAAAMRIYKALEEDFYAEIESGTITAANAMVKALRLQQITSGFGKTESGEEIQVDTAKEKLLEDLLEDIDEPVAVFCRFHHDLDTIHRVAKRLKKGSQELSGRVDDLKGWQGGGAPILAVQIQAGGVGIDLSRAKIAIYYSLGVSLGDHLQSQSRLEAYGQTHQLAYYYLLADGTIDHKVFRALQAKQDVIEALLRRD
ncbi:MAG TPA: DEAD/DEAH box helicase [Anaerolineales bacterium]